MPCHTEEMFINIPGLEPGPADKRNCHVCRPASKTFSPAIRFYGRLFTTKSADLIARFRGSKRSGVLVSRMPCPRLH